MPSKSALVLAGGGLSGAVYEMGALRAIDDLLLDLTVNDFDIYVGTSAGSIVSAGLANGMSPQEMLQSVAGTHPTIAAFSRRHLFRFNARATLGRLVKMPTTLLRTLNHYRHQPADLNLIDLLWELSATLPSALYDPLALEEYVCQLLDREGMYNRFDRLQKELYIVATSLNNGQRVVFGEGDTVETPISLAVAASTAVPVLYKPVRIGDSEFIDGGLRGTASLDVAIERGAKLVVCINPLVPVDSTRADWPGSQFLGDQGMQVMIDQVFRIILHSSLHYHIKQLRRRHPEVDIILIEPRRDDADLMLFNVMRYSTRLMIAQHGYRSATSDLSLDYHYFKAVLARHGIAISRSKVKPRLQQMATSNNDLEVVEEVLDVHRSKEIGPLRSALTEIEQKLEQII